MSAELAAACLMGSFTSTEAPRWLLERIEHGLGGVCLFAQNVVDDAQVTEMCANLHAARQGVIIATDEEGGDVTRLDAAAGSDMPAPAAFGYVDDVALTHDAFASIGRRLSRVGIDLVLAPCADINCNERNPVIGVRSFGATPDVVTRHVVSCVAGYQAGGAAACVKHYPGHGDTVHDTHLGAARIDLGLAELEHRELVPFRAAVAAGVDAVLTAHVVASCLDDRPASLSAKWNAHLRNDLGFDGAIITDALDMGAIAGGRGIAGIADAAVDALAAGADFLCLGPNFDAAGTDRVIAAVGAAIDDGRLDGAALSASRDRIARLRRTQAATEMANEILAASIVARRAVTIDGTLPRVPSLVIECRPQPHMASFNVTWGLARHLQPDGWPVVTLHEGEPVEPALAGWTGPVTISVRDAAVHTWQTEVIRRVATTGRVVVAVELGWPAHDRPATPISPYIVSHGASRASTTAVAEALRSAVHG